MKKTIIMTKDKFFWNIERIISKKKKLIATNGLPQGKKIILAPHSDDEWIGCSQIIIKEKNSVIINMNMSGNDTEEIHKIRYNEMINTSKKFKIKMITIKDNKTDNLLELINKEKPKFICVPYYIDWHEEHIEIMNILKKTLKNINDLNIIMYQVSIPIHQSDITNYISLNKKDWKRKWIHFKKVYKTQNNFPSYRYSTNERINGKNFGAYAAEVYSIQSSFEWKKNLEKNLLTSEQKYHIKRLLYSITKTRNYLNNIKEN